MLKDAIGFAMIVASILMLWAVTPANAADEDDYNSNYNNSMREIMVESTREQMRLNEEHTRCIETIQRYGNDHRCDQRGY